MVAPRAGARAVQVSATTVPRRLVLVGSVVADVTLRVPRLPERGGDVITTTLSISAGGGMFVLRAAIRGGLPAVYAGRHGAGPFGDVVRAALLEVGVEAAYGPDQVGDTGPCIVLVEPDGERTMITSNGVEAELGAAWLSGLDLRSDDAVYVSGYDLGYPVTGPAFAAWLPEVPPAALLVLDPGPLVAKIPAVVLDPVLARTDVLTLSDREAERLCGSDDPEAVARSLRPRIAPGGVVVLRSGAHGATLLEPGRPPEAVAAVPVATADSTGAGDTHAGAVMAVRAKGLPWSAAVRAANEAVAAFLAERT